MTWRTEGSNRSLDLDKSPYQSTINVKMRGSVYMIESFLLLVQTTVFFAQGQLNNITKVTN